MKEGFKRLEKAFRKAYLSRVSPTPSSDWEFGVMREIAYLDTSRNWGFWTWFDSFFWRLAPVLVTLLLVLGFMAFSVSVIPRDLTNGLLQDPLTLTLAAVFGV